MTGSWPLPWLPRRCHHHSPSSFRPSSQHTALGSSADHTPSCPRAFAHTISSAASVSDLDTCGTHTPSLVRSLLNPIVTALPCSCLKQQPSPQRVFSFLGCLFLCGIPTLEKDIRPLFASRLPRDAARSVQTRALFISHFLFRG